MKKNFFMLAATAALFAACAETDLVNDVNAVVEPQAIGFETFANKATRAENSSETETLGLEEHHDNFQVWAYKDVATAYVFDGVEVSHNGTAWTYGPTKYWDKAANSYEFYAAAPVDAKWTLNEGTTAKNDDYFTYSDYELQDETHSSTEYQESFETLPKNKDLLIASPETVGEAAILAANDVQLDFNHILSRLNVTVKKHSDLTAKVVLTSIAVKELINIASFDESKATVTSASADATTVRWTKTTNKYNITGNALAEVETTAKYVLQSLVIPQTVVYETVDRNGTSTETAPYLYIEYTIGGEPFNATYNLANAFGLTAAGDIPFNEGWQNTLNITINAASIVFDAVTYKWEDYKESGKNID